MKWYGISTINYNKLVTNSKKKIKKKIKKYSRFLNNKINLKINPSCFHIPSTWTITIIKNDKNNIINVYMNSSEYFFTLALPSKILTLKFDLQINSLIFLFLFKNNYFSIFFFWFRQIFYSFSRIFFKKLRFKGKGYYMYKDFRNTIALQFGYSHRIYLYSYFTFVKFLTKTTIFVFGVNPRSISTSSKGLYDLRPINIFTGKGIRFSRQILYRKTGKISSYR